MLSLMPISKANPTLEPTAEDTARMQGTYKETPPSPPPNPLFTSPGTKQQNRNTKKHYRLRGRNSQPKR